MSLGSPHCGIFSSISVSNEDPIPGLVCLSDFDRFSLGIKVTAKDADMLYVVSNLGPRFFWNDDCLVRSLCRQSIP